MLNRVLCDTSFLIRLLNRNDALNSNARLYYEYFLDEGWDIYVSTIASSEFGVKDNIFKLLDYPFNISAFEFEHSIKSSEMARIVFDEKAKRGAKFSSRLIVPNDTKMMAQAELLNACYITSDSESKKVYDILKNSNKISIDFIDLNTPISETFGIIEL